MRLIDAMINITLGGPSVLPLATETGKSWVKLRTMEALLWN